MSGATKTIPGPVAKPLDVQWIHGSPSSKHNTDPDLQIYWYDENTAILRQNKAIDYEAPFLFLLFGQERAVLLDTGATASPDFFPLRRIVDGLIDTWLDRNPRSDYGLLVIHTHGHDDHVAGDDQFADRPDTVLVKADKDDAWEFFGFSSDADAIRPVDLGGRVLQAFATPGHHSAAVTFYDPWTGILFTGDTVYRGRLYIVDWAAFSRSIDRLIEFCATPSGNARHRMSHRDDPPSGRRLPGPDLIPARRATVGDDGGAPERDPRRPRRRGSRACAAGIRRLHPLAGGRRVACCALAG